MIRKGILYKSIENRNHSVKLKREYKNAWEETGLFQKIYYHQRHEPLCNDSRGGYFKCCENEGIACPLEANRTDVADKLS